jgi:hypothetical protein
MSLGYDVIGDEWAEAWMKLYDQSREVSHVVLPNEVYYGLSTGLRSIFDLSKYGLEWFFVGPPKIETVKRGFSSVEVDLEGRNARVLGYSASGGLSPAAPPPILITPPGEPYVPLPDGDVTDVDEVGDVYFIVDDYIDEVYGGVIPGGAGATTPGPSLALGADFITSGTYSLADSGSNRNFYIASWDEDGFEVWSNMFALSGAGGEVRNVGMLTQAQDGRIVAAVRESSPDRHTLVGCDSNGSNPVVLASYTRAAEVTASVRHFARNYPSGYVFCGTTADRLQYVVAKIREDFSIENTVTLTPPGAGVVSDWSLATDPSGSGRIFIGTLTDGIYCLDAGLNVAWAARPGMLIKDISVNSSGNVAVTGLTGDLDDEVPFMILSPTDGSVLLQCQIQHPDASLGVEGRFIAPRPEGGYILSSADSSITPSYGWTDHVGLNEDLDVIDFAIRLSSYLPTSTPFHNAFPEDRAVFTNTKMLLTHRATYGPRDRAITSTGYLITNIDNADETAPGTFGPDPKLVVAITPTIESSFILVDGISVTRTSGGPFEAASSRVAPVDVPIGRVTYPRTPLPEP